MRKNLLKIALIVLAVAAAAVVMSLVMIGITPHREDKVTRPPSASASGDPASVKNAKELMRQGKKAEAIKILEEVVSAKKGPQEASRALTALAEIYRGDGNLLKAKESYILLTKEYPAYCDYSDIQNRLTALNMEILFSPIPTAGSEIYIVKPGDSLVGIAKRYSTTAALIKRANGLKTDMIKPGMKLKVQNMPFSVIVDKSQSTLTLILNNEVIKTYAVSTGKNNSTPTGTFKIKNKLIDPPWYSPAGSVLSPGDPENALGSRWMGFEIAKPDYGIHGTNDPKSVGYQCTEGCVRMHNADVEELFSILPEGTEVTIID